VERSSTASPAIGRWPGRTALAGALLFGSVSPALTQTIRGTVLEELSGRPVIGGLVQLLASARVGASVVTDEHGRFLLPDVSSGSYRIRVLRIGFRPWSSDSLLLVAGETRTLTLVVPAVPVVLDDITVEGTSACRSSPDADRRMALVWDQARTSLGLLGGGRRDLDYRVTVTRRRLDAMGRVNHLEVLPTLGQGAWPVTSQPAESLAQLGFVQPADTLSGPVYYGPDVAVFFSDAFLQTHCFRLVAAPKAQPSLLGVGFAPVSSRTLPDIEGTLWLDRGTGLLHRLEYRYTRLWHWVPVDAAGGSLDFSRLRNGTPIISGWTLKAPVARRLPWRRSESDARRFFGQTEVTFGGFREEEAVVTEVLNPDGGALWKRPAAGEEPAVAPRPLRR